MNQTNNPKLTGISKVLRKNMTKEEKHLWYDFLKYLPQTVQRQKVIGKYIVDFYCASANLVIELDGLQHYEKKGQEQDRVRDQYFNGMGIKVLRYSNSDIHDHFDQVCLDILEHISTLPIL